ncbi:hypothetical protein [Neobacillus sp. PS2-9]|uniref:hypothetical protein n=1 Tax=Neobacillus sp. PS2-9 TaxID=3070676 RepID=UPI0027E1EDF3|nr:hypothetical protein [Neobacillus sp. PS2-9]WML56079.1 hypothetical protein RCG25_14120 [Neobacillus sp. PS2-9]
MDKNTRKVKLEALLQKQKEKERNDERKRQLSLMLEPFLTKGSIELLDDAEKEKMKTLFISSIPIIKWVILDLEKMKNKFEINNVSCDKVASFFHDKKLYTENLVYFFLKKIYHLLAHYLG